MFKKMAALLAVVSCFVFSSFNSPLDTGASAAAPIWTKSEAVAYAGGKQTVKMVDVDLKNPKLKIDVVAANGKIGSTATLSSIVKSVDSSSNKVVAAINGTFFDAYTKTGPMQPWGTIVKNGQALHLSAQYATVGFTDTKEMKIERLKIGIEGKVSDNADWSSSWYAWNINHVDPRAESIVIFTPEYGKSTGKHDKTSIVISKDKVIKVTKGEVSIPSDGFVVVTGDQAIINRLQLGYTASFTQKMMTKAYTKDAAFNVAQDWSAVNTAVSAGPTLLKNGKVVADSEEEGFKNSKIVNKKGQRSFIGVKKDQTLVMGTVPNVTIKELAEIVKKLGLVDAINLDGGASSGLYYEGKYLHEPGRDICNALVFSVVK